MVPAVALPMHEEKATAVRVPLRDKYRGAPSSLPAVYRDHELALMRASAEMDQPALGR